MAFTPEPITEEQVIKRKLYSLEKEYKVKILYACEAGSRVWGFESPDSDYDIRFIYAHDTDYYLSYDIESKSNVIEYMDPTGMYDYVGWDIKKALSLYAKSNGNLFEWVTSPVHHIVYGSLHSSLSAMVESGMYDIAKLRYHYRGLATKHYHRYIKDKDEVSLKKYLYCLRAFIAELYIIQYQRVPPLCFKELCKLSCPVEVIDSVYRLLDTKTTHPELTVIKRVPSIDEFLLKAMEGTPSDYKPRPFAPEVLVHHLNTLFRNSL